MTTRAGDTHLKESLLEVYCLGTASPEETAQIEAWFSANPGRRDWYEQLRAGLREGDFPPISTEERSATWLGVIRAAFHAYPEIDDTPLSALESGGTAKATYRIISEHSGGKLGTGPQTFRTAREKEGVFSGRTLRSWKWSIATVVSLGVMCLVLGWHMARGHNSQQSYTVYTTGNGERATITLPDGGTVSLNVASRLDVPVDYATGNHTVRLDGEALFTASHHTGQPLTVLAGGVGTRVLGTSFIVRRYASDAAALVAVYEGKVGVGGTVVVAQQLGEVSRSGVVHIRPIDRSLASFTSGVLTIETMPLQRAIVELDRWYNADIRLGDPALARQPMKGEFTAGSLDNLTEVLGLMFDVHVVRTGRVITLFPRH